MRRKAYALLAGAAMLLLIGAGCGAKQASNANERSEDFSSNASVDAAAEDILKNDGEEEEHEKKVEEEADNVNDDKAELNGYSESSYELK